MSCLILGFKVVQALDGGRDEGCHAHANHKETQSHTPFLQHTHNTVSA
jgi:hypothetical protein